MFNAVQEERSSLASTPTSSTNSLSSIPPKFTRSSSLCGDSPPNFSHFHEVLFLGKIKSSHKRAPPTFIDDSLNKFRQRDAKIAEDSKENEEGDSSNSNGSDPSTVNHPLLGSTVNNSQSKEPSSDNDKKPPCSAVKNRTMLLQVKLHH